MPVRLEPKRNNYRSKDDTKVLAVKSLLFTIGVIIFGMLINPISLNSFLGAL